MLEDFERIREIEMMYLIEEQRRIEEEWEQWEEEQNRKPAIIHIIGVKEEKHETIHNTTSL